MADALPPGLTEPESVAFRRDGLLLTRRALAPPLLARLRAVAAGAVRAAGPALAARHDIVAAGAANAHHHPVLDCARDAGLDALIEPLVDSAGAPWSCALLFASERDAAAVPWQQDDAAWPIRRSGTVAVRIALDRVDRDNGCTRLLPRSHERLVREIRNARDRRQLVLPPERIDPAIVVEAVRDPGEITLYDACTFLCEPANRSGRPRAAVVFRYAPAGSAAPAPPAES